ncbi:hypothetical protein [Actinomadura sp. 6N118]|uniref:hypothetical protein n=1 Tax=Actinomadura sp. 6N118 TaxID=3375151 RepID=UPI0037A323F0
MERSDGTPVLRRSDGMPVLWVCGPVGVGKSTIGFEIFMQVIRDGVRAAYVDVKQIGFMSSADEIWKANLAAMQPVFSEAGARCLIVSGGVDDPDASVLPECAVTVCRLHAGPDQLTERIMARGGGAGPAIPGDDLRGQPAATLREIARQAIRDAAAPQSSGMGSDIRIDTGNLSVEESARAALAAWPLTGRLG